MMAANPIMTGVTTIMLINPYSTALICTCSHVSPAGAAYGLASPSSPPSNCASNSAADGEPIGLSLAGDEAEGAGPDCPTLCRKGECGGGGGEPILGDVAWCGGVVGIEGSFLRDPLHLLRLGDLFV